MTKMLKCDGKGCEVDNLNAATFVYCKSCYEEQKARAEKAEAKLKKAADELEDISHDVANVYGIESKIQRRIRRLAKELRGEK